MASLRDSLVIAYKSQDFRPGLSCFVLRTALPKMTRMLSDREVGGVPTGLRFVMFHSQDLRPGLSCSVLRTGCVGLEPIPRTSVLGFPVSSFGLVVLGSNPFLTSWAFLFRPADWLCWARVFLDRPKEEVSFDHVTRFFSNPQATRAV